MEQRRERWIWAAGVGSTEEVMEVRRCYGAGERAMEVGRGQ